MLSFHGVSKEMDYDYSTTSHEVMKKVSLSVFVCVKDKTFPRKMGISQADVYLKLRKMYSR